MNRAHRTLILTVFWVGSLPLASCDEPGQPSQGASQSPQEASQPPQEAAHEWIVTIRDALLPEEHALNPPNCSRIFGLVAVAMYEVVASTSDVLRPLQGQLADWNHNGDTGS